jgi:hypothetical protein
VVKKIKRATIDEIPMEIRLNVLINFLNVKDLDKIKKSSLFFPQEMNDAVWTKMQNPLWRECTQRFKKNMRILNLLKLEELFKHIKYYFPKLKHQKVITAISEMDYNNKVIIQRMVS